MCRLRNKHPDTLGLLTATTVDAIVRKIESSWKGAFTRWRKSGKAEFPQTKRRVYSLPLVYGSGVKYFPAEGKRHGHLRIKNVPGLIRVREHRALPDTPIKTVNIRSEKDGTWYAVFVYEESPELACVEHARPVGIDLNLSAGSRIAWSDGEHDGFFEGPEIVALHEARHTRLDRAVSRKFKPGVRQSNRYRDAKRARARLASKIARCRADWIHNVTAHLAKTHEHIYCEDLSPGFMLKNRRQAAKAADASFGEFKRMLEYKCGDRVTFVNPAYTSQRCSQCGNLKPMPLSERVYRCEECGLELDRDTNAARNVLRAGEKGETKSQKASV